MAGKMFPTFGSTSFLIEYDKRGRIKKDNRSILYSGGRGAGKSAAIYDHVSKSLEEGELKMGLSGKLTDFIGPTLDGTITYKSSDSTDLMHGDVIIDEASGNSLVLNTDGKWVEIE